MGALFHGFLFNVGIGLAAWAMGLVVSMLLGALIVVVRRVERIVVGFCAIFCLLPLPLMPPILSTIGQPSIVLGGITVFPIECVLIAAGCLFPTIEAVSAAMVVIEPRYRSLAALANLGPFQRLRRLAAPYLVNAVLVGAASTLPFALLYAVMFEWSRGDAGGIGRALQGIVQQGENPNRWTLVIVIAVVACGLYAVVHLFQRWFARRYSVSLDTGANGDLAQEPQRRTRLEPLLVLGVAMGLLAYLAAWFALFRSLPLDPSIAMTPDALLQKLQRVAASPESQDMKTLLRVVVAGFLTTLFALFAMVTGIVASACAAVAAYRWAWVRFPLTAAVSVSQAVPIFVLIPFYLLVFRLDWLVVVVVTVSVTFFASYQVIYARLQAVPSIWQDLLTSASPRGRWMLPRQIRHWYGPLVVHYGSAALTVVAPSALAAALITDFFLPGKLFHGLGWMSQYEARTDLFFGMLILNLSLIIVVVLFLFSRSAPIRRYG